MTLCSETTGSDHRARGLLSVVMTCQRVNIEGDMRTLLFTSVIGEIPYWADKSNWQLITSTGQLLRGVYVTYIAESYRVLPFLNITVRIYMQLTAIALTLIR